MKMPQVNNIQELKEQKQHLRKRCNLLENELKINYNHIKEEFSPGSLVKAAWKSITAGSDFSSSGSLNGVMAMASEFLLRKVAKGKTEAPVYSLGFIAARYALRYAIKNKKQIIHALSGMMNNALSRNKKSGNATFDQSTAGDGYYF